MIRWIEKKNWRNNVQACWTVSENLNKCLDKSQSFESLNPELKSIIRKSVDKNYIVNYINAWINSEETSALSLFNTNSSLWENNSESLDSLNSECNILSLHECCKEKFSLDNLEGDYENFAQSLKK